jgi:hypothetical protein
MDMAALKNSPWFWEGAFILAVLLLVGAHKLSIEGMIKT